MLLTRSESDIDTHRLDYRILWTISWAVKYEKEMLLTRCNEFKKQQGSVLLAHKEKNISTHSLGYRIVWIISCVTCQV